MAEFDIMNCEVEDVKRLLDDYTWTWYGVGGWGKSQICGYLYEDPAFWLWEQGANAIRAKKVPVADWKQAREHLKALKKAYKDGKPMPFKTAIMDTVDVAWMKCTKWVCEQNGWDDPSDGEWGKGHNKVREEWDLFMGDLENMGIKPVFISHDKDKEIKPKRGEKYQEIQPAVSQGCQAVIYDKVDFVVYCNIEKDEEGNPIRKMYFRSNGDFRAKSRLLYMPESVEYGVTPRDASISVREAFDKAIIDEFGAEGEEPPTQPKKSIKKTEKKTDKKVEAPKKEEETKPVAEEEKVEKVEKKKEEKAEKVEKKKEEKVAPPQEDDSESLADVKKELEDKFMKLYKSGKKTPVELIALVEKHTGAKRITAIDDLKGAKALREALNEVEEE